MRSGRVNSRVVRRRRLVQGVEVRKNLHQQLSFYYIWLSDQVQCGVAFAWPLCGVGGESNLPITKIIMASYEATQQSKLEHSYLKLAVVKCGMGISRGIPVIYYSCPIYFKLAFTSFKASVKRPSAEEFKTEITMGRPSPASYAMTRLPPARSV